jgi:hypothetical protein
MGIGTSQYAMAKRAEEVQKRKITDIFNSHWTTKMLSQKVLVPLKEMGNSELAIYNWQNQRLLMSVAVGLVGIIGFVFTTFLGIKKINLAVLGGGIVFAFLLYFVKGMQATGQYKTWKFQRNIAFTRFARLVVPYLYDTMQGVALYEVFATVLKRMEYEEDKNFLRTLMIEIESDSKTAEPFLKFARKMSGTDFSLTFMNVLYDINCGLTDITVVENLSELATKEMNESMQSIADMKEHKFVMFPTKITMLSLVLVFSFAIAMGIYYIKDAGVSF